MPKALPRSTHFLFCRLSAAWPMAHIGETTLTQPDAPYTVIDKSSQAEVYSVPDQLEISEEGSERSIRWLQLWRLRADCSSNKNKANEQMTLKLIPVRARRKLGTWAEGNLKSLQDSILRLHLISGTSLPCDKLLMELLVLTGYSLCSALGWTAAEKTDPLSSETKHSEGL